MRKKQSICHSERSKESLLKVKHNTTYYINILSLSKDLNEDLYR